MLFLCKIISENVAAKIGHCVGAGINSGAMDKRIPLSLSNPLSIPVLLKGTSGIATRKFDSLGLLIRSKKSSVWCSEFPQVVNPSTCFKTTRPFQGDKRGVKSIVKELYSDVLLFDSKSILEDVIAKSEFFVRRRNKFRR